MATSPGGITDPLPGGIGLSHITPYECGGSPHLHLACTEAYVVTAGHGSVQTLNIADGFVETPLEPGVVAWFTPGTVHRMMPGPEGDLRVTVLMQNSGLPEAGDAVFTFPEHVLADPDTYTSAAALPEEGRADAAALRRDLAVEGYEVLREALVKGDEEPLLAFHRAAVRIVGPRLGVWEPRWREGALAAAQRTGEHLAALAEGDPAHLAAARVRAAGPSRHGGFGMCGRREEYELPGVTLPYHRE